jgi:hypothetical protein
MPTNLSPQSKALEKLLSVFSVEQLEIIADRLSRAQGLAIDRRCIQTVEVVFSEKGFPRYLNGSDSVQFPAPATKIYHAE